MDSFRAVMSVKMSEARELAKFFRSLNSKEKLKI